jgi:Na+(H+)/acetate symporter ActP
MRFSSVSPSKELRVSVVKIKVAIVLLFVFLFVLTRGIRTTLMFRTYLHTYKVILNPGMLCWNISM